MQLLGLIPPLQHLHLDLAAAEAAALAAVAAAAQQQEVSFYLQTKKKGTHTCLLLMASWVHACMVFDF